MSAPTPRPPRYGSSMAARSNRRTPRSCSLRRTSTAPWSAAPASIRPTSRRSLKLPVEPMSPLPAGPTSIPVPSLALVILDGWGLAPDGPGNAVSQADTPVFDELWSTYPHTTLSTSGRDVGLPEGQMGNSEVGHLNLGAGAVVKQDLARIDDAIADGSFFEN